jgi:transcriptional regulator with XRE-family HTH domain
MSDSGSPSLVRRQLGQRLRRLREKAGKTHDDVFEAQIASRTKMWRIESGRMAIKQGDVLALCMLYGVDATVAEDLARMATATKGSGYQEEFGESVSPSGSLYAEMESAAALVQDFHCQLIPGLLQTADYTRAIAAANTTLSPRIVEQRVTFRVQRQRAFFRRPRPGRLHVVMPAGVLGLVVGSTSVMEAQIAHLRAVNTGDGVSIRVLSATNGVYPGMRGSFIILGFDTPDDPPLVYLESLVGRTYVERADHVAEFQRTFDRIRDQAISLEEYLE